MPSEIVPSEIAPSEIAPSEIAPGAAFPLSRVSSVNDTQNAQGPAFEKMAQTLVDAMEHYIERGLSPAEALQRVRNDDHLVALEALPNTPLRGLGWFDLRAAETAKPGVSQKVLDLMRTRARAEIRSGVHGAEAVEDAKTSPWQRQMYLALLDELSEEWAPRNGIERTLLEQMAQAHSNYLHWQCRLNAVLAQDRTTFNTKDKDAHWHPRVTHAQAIEQTAAMLDRFQRMFLRTQRALRDLRRHAIHIEHAGQVNVGEQQVNMAHSG